MGASQPIQPPNPSQIKVNVYLNLPNYGSINDFQSGAAPLPNSGINASVEAKDSENKNYKVQLNVIDNSINNNDNISKESTNNEEEKNINNNIGQNNIGQNSYIKDLGNSNYSLFNSNNLQDINNNIINNNNIENNKNKNENNNEIKNNENNYYEKIRVDEDKNDKEKNNDNNLLKEGVKQVTKFGDDEEESKDNKQETNRGNEVDINMGKKENIYDNNGNTIDGEQKDLNIGSNFRKNEEEGEDNYKRYNYSESDFEISQYQNVSEQKTLEQSQTFSDKGYLLLFIRLNDYEPKYFNVDKNTTLKLILKTYSEKTPQFDMNILNDIKLYCGENPLDINKEIKYLNLENLSLITNFMRKNTTPNK
jgi:hypothetical protein